MSPIDWLCDKAFGFKELPPEERDAIMHFCLLWSYFEGQALDNEASADKLIDLARRFEHQGRLNIASFNESLTHFRERYFQNGAATEYFGGLFREGKDRKVSAFVRSAFVDENTDDADCIAAVLLVVYRLRNNLMHGSKWDEDLLAQRDNFRHANYVLMRVTDSL